MDIIKIIQESKCKLVDVSDPQGFSIVEPKMDGWWVVVCVGEHSVTCYSSGAQVMWTRESEAYLKPAIFQGEWIERTNWAQGQEFKGKVYLHDVYQMGDTLVTQEPYLARRSYLRQWLKKYPQTELIEMPMWTINHEKQLWKQYVQEQHYEGLVYKNVDGKYGVQARIGRRKAAFTIDYICMGINEGGGRLAGKMGSLTGGLIINGIPTPVCSVGGGYSDQERQDIWDHKDEYMGKVFQASGKQVFSGGTLRHPNFDRWREDKKAEECTWTN